MIRHARFLPAAIAIAAFCISLHVPAWAQDQTVSEGDVGTLTKSDLEKVHPAKPPYSPYAGRNFPTRPFFGDTHLHTVVLDGRRRLRRPAGPGRRLPLRPGRGDHLLPGQPVKLSRPLDFLVVADHSDNMGFFPTLLGGDPELLADPTGQDWYDKIKAGQGARRRMESSAASARTSFPRRCSRARYARPTEVPGRRPSRRRRQYNEPGRFTAFIGYEWTSNAGGNNLHRNVIFRDGGDKAGQVEPYTTHAAARQRQPRGPVEMDGGLRGRRPAATCWPSPTTATCPTA